MSLTTSVQPWLREVGAREASVLTARTHVFAETTTDTDRICATVSQDVFFGVPVRTRSGNEISDGTVLTSYEQVRGYYEGRADSYVVLASSQLKSVASEWYVFNESAATLRGEGAVGAASAAGVEFVVNSAVLFPTAEDGIRGEICVTRHPFDDIVTGRVEPPPPLGGSSAHLPLREIEHCALLDRVGVALRDGDTAGLAKELAENHTLAVRLDDAAGGASIHTATGRADALAQLGALFEGASDLTLVNRIATDWYVFAEYLLRLADGGVRRLALTHPVHGGRLGGSFGYGRTDRR